jgi:hypothetical protein
VKVEVEVSADSTSRSISRVNYGATASRCHSAGFRLPLSYLLRVIVFPANNQPVLDIFSLTENREQDRVPRKGVVASYLGEDGG